MFRVRLRECLKSSDDPSAGTNAIALAVNPATNQVFVSSFDSGIITVIDGTTNAEITALSVPSPLFITANSATNQVYVTNPNVNTVTLIDGATFTTSTLTDPNAKGPAALAINSAVGEVYVANDVSNNVSVFGAQLLVDLDPAPVPAPPAHKAQQARRVRKDLRGRKVLLELKGPEDRMAPLGGLAAKCGVSLSQRARVILPSHPNSRPGTTSL